MMLSAYEKKVHNKYLAFREKRSNGILKMFSYFISSKVYA